MAVQFEEQYNKYKHIIFKQAKRHKLSGYDVDDLAQEFSMVLVKCLESFDESKNTSFETYFNASCNNHFYSLLRKHKDVILLEDNDFVLDETTMDSSLYDDVLEIVNDFDDELLKKIYLLFMSSTLKQYEIADKLGISSSLVSNKIKEAQIKIRELL